MATKITVPKGKTTAMTGNPSLASRDSELTMGAFSHGSGSPQHAPKAAFQTYTDDETGKSYIWLGGKWT